MTTIINYGINSQGNHNKNTINNHIDFDSITNELYILKNHCNENIEFLIEASKQKKHNILLKGLKSLKKETIDIIIHLGLSSLTLLIKKLFS